MVTPNFWETAERAVWFHWVLTLDTKLLISESYLKKKSVTCAGQKTTCSPETGVSRLLWGALCGCRDLNTEPLEKQEGLWPESSCQPLKLLLFCLSRTITNTFKLLMFWGTRLKKQVLGQEDLRSRSPLPVVQTSDQCIALQCWAGSQGSPRISRRIHIPAV